MYFFILIIFLLPSVVLASYTAPLPTKPSAPPVQQSKPSYTPPPQPLNAPQPSVIQPAYPVHYESLPDDDRVRIYRNPLLSPIDRDKPMGFFSLGFDVGRSRFGYQLHNEDIIFASPSVTADIAAGVHTSIMDIAFSYTPTRSDGGSFFRMHAVSFQFSRTLIQNVYGLLGVGYSFGTIKTDFEPSVVSTEDYTSIPYIQLGLGYRYIVSSLPLVLDGRVQYQSGTFTSDPSLPYMQFRSFLFRFGLTYILKPF